jgi:hypothetical protein
MVPLQNLLCVIVSYSGLFIEFLLFVQRVWRKLYRALNCFADLWLLITILDRKNSQRDWETITSKNPR